MKTGALYIVATPIGNLADISQRALDILSRVEVIAAEDTRHSQKLLQHYGIQKQLISLHEHNERARAEQILQLLQQGKDVALISDAGTPLISDPGYLLIKTLRNANITIVPIPGACAAIAALSASGLPTERFIFEGFLPAKSAQRQQRLQVLVAETRTLIFYEAPHRILDLLEDLIVVFGVEREAVLAKELTNTFENIISGVLPELKSWLEIDPARTQGEFVVLIHGAAATTKDSDAESSAENTLKILLSELPLKQAVALTTTLTGMKKNWLYQIALKYEKNASKNYPKK
jgi:16S rRNA (cytidine1402-2'-O)-methyltransferase